MKEEKQEKPYLGRIPIAPPGMSFKDKKKYNRKVKHKRTKLYESNSYFTKKEF